MILSNPDFFNVTRRFGSHVLRKFEICRIPGAVLIPLQQLPSRLGELDPAQEIVFQCKVGGRSANATAYLQRAGFARARNLTGGILAWIDQVDPSQPKY